jgi:phage/plasmid primase-like uncharacterized protein
MRAARTAAEVAQALGGARRSGQWWRCRCPVHRSGGPTLALRDGAFGVMVYCHACCSRGDVFAELRRRGLIGGISNHAEPAPAMADADQRADIARRLTLARRIWDAAFNARGTPVGNYLAGRGISSLPVPPSLRWAPRCWHPSRIYLPAMVGLVVNVNGELIGVHRTFLRPDGSGKADIDPQKASLGPIAGGAVRMGELRPQAPLIVGEGIESALAMSELTDWPAWAALCASGVERLSLPQDARNIVIAVDRDHTGIGEASARRAASRWVSERRRVRLVIPNRIGSDGNDLLQEARRAG